MWVIVFVIVRSIKMLVMMHILDSTYFKWEMEFVPGISLVIDGCGFQARFRRHEDL